MRARFSEVLPLHSAQLLMSTRPLEEGSSDWQLFAHRCLPLDQTWRYQPATTEKGPSSVFPAVPVVEQPTAGADRFLKRPMASGRTQTECPLWRHKLCAALTWLASYTK